MNEETAPESLNDKLTTLLANPRQLFRDIAEGKDVDAPSLFLIGVACFGLFGFATGLFSGWNGAFVGLFKGALITVLAQLLCLPSLFILSCVGGLPIRFSQVVQICAAITATLGLILVAFAPVAWLFSISTESLGFVVSLSTLIVFIAYHIARRLFRSNEETPLKSRGLHWWLVLQLVVTLQMTTALRPILITPDEPLWAQEKKIFVVHFFDAFRQKKKEPAIEKKVETVVNRKETLRSARNARRRR